MGFGVNRYLTGRAEPDFSYLGRTPILNTTAGTHVRSKIIKNWTDSPDHSIRPLLVSSYKFNVTSHLLFFLDETRIFIVSKNPNLFFTSAKSQYTSSVLQHMVVHPLACFGIWSNKSLVQQHPSPWEYLAYYMEGLHLSFAKKTSP